MSDDPMSSASKPPPDKSKPPPDTVIVSGEPALSMNRAEPFEKLLTIQARVLEMIATGEPLKKILRVINSMTEALDTGLFCSALLFDPASQRLFHGDAAGLPSEYIRYIEGIRIGPHVGACGTAAYYKELVVCHDIATDPLWEDYREKALSFGLRSSWAVPVFSRHGSVLGTFAIYSREPRSPTAYHLAALQSAAHLASVAIERQRSEEDRSHLAAIVDSSSDAIISFHLDGRIRTWNGAAERMFGYRVSEIVGNSCGDLLPSDPIHKDEDCLEQIRGGLFAHTQEATLLRKDRSSLDVDISMFPIYVGTELIGASWIVQDIRERKRTQERLAQQAHELAALGDALREANAELTRAYDATIEGWSRALDLRDQETEGHSRRVTEMTLQLAERMGLTGDDLMHIRRGALLHDIGKMGIPDAILLKPGPLTDEEWGIMRRHPALAHELLLPIAFLRPALPIPFCHHERWNGSGYPQGLKEKAIPLVARIFAVADVWDALRSDRPYRAGWSKERVRDYIQQQSDVLFDPAVVAAFLELPEADRIF